MPFHIKRKSKYDFQELFEGLRLESNEAFAFLSEKVSPGIHKIARQHGLSREDAEDLIHEVILALILKIRSGEYVFQGHDPASYAIEGAKLRIQTQMRTGSRRWAKEQHADFIALWKNEGSSDGLTVYNDATEKLEQLDRLIDQLGPRCRQLISLHYFDNTPDKEVVEKKLTPYNTVGALKAKRWSYIQKLKEAIEISKSTSSDG